MPSHNENFGIVYAESLAAGTPIIASTKTPWNEVVENDCGKWINNTIEETAKAINEILERDREIMKINSKILALKYNWTNVAKEFKNLFENMTETK